MKLSNLVAVLLTVVQHAASAALCGDCAHAPAVKRGSWLRNYHRYRHDHHGGHNISILGNCTTYNVTMRHKCISHGHYNSTMPGNATNSNITTTGSMTYQTLPSSATISTSVMMFTAGMYDLPEPTRLARKAITKSVDLRPLLGAIASLTTLSPDGYFPTKTVYTSTTTFAPLYTTTLSSLKSGKQSGTVRTTTVPAVTYSYTNSGTSLAFTAVGTTVTLTHSLSRTTPILGNSTMHTVTSVNKNATVSTMTLPTLTVSLPLKNLTSIYSSLTATTTKT